MIMNGCNWFSYNILYNNTRFALSTTYILEFNSRIKNIISQVPDVSIVEDNDRCDWVMVDSVMNSGVITGKLYIKYGDYLSDTRQFVNILENNYPYVETIVGLTFGLLLPFVLLFYVCRKRPSSVEEKTDEGDIIRKNIKNLIVSRRKGYENIKDLEIIEMFSDDYEEYIVNILEYENEKKFKYCDLCRIKYPTLYQCSDGTNKCEECSI